MVEHLWRGATVASHPPSLSRSALISILFLHSFAFGHVFVVATTFSSIWFYRRLHVVLVVRYITPLYSYRMTKNFLALRRAGKRPLPSPVWFTLPHLGSSPRPDMLILCHERLHGHLPVDYRKGCRGREGANTVSTMLALVSVQFKKNTSFSDNGRISAVYKLISVARANQDERAASTSAQDQLAPHVSVRWVGRVAASLWLASGNPSH
jgi:hypothetical protein